MIRVLLLWICAFLCVVQGRSIPKNAAPLPSFRNIALQNETTVFGVSAGAYMATQMEVALSSQFIGAGIIAGGPFYCAQNSEELALTSCMITPTLISVLELVGVTRTTALSGYIDSVDHLSKHRVFIYSGTKDSVVHPGVVKKTAEYYSHFVSRQEQIKPVFNVPSEHAWITDHYGNACTYKGSPFINNCGIDLTGQMLQHIYSGSTLNLKPRATSVPDENLIPFDQKEFFPGFPESDFLSLDDVGLVYIPTACQNKTSVCRLAINFHGCLMGVSMIQDTFAKNNGLNLWAETNNIIVLYPQARASILNPRGCFDWWGYSAPSYASKVGPQVTVISKMMARIFGYDHK